MKKLVFLSLIVLLLSSCTSIKLVTASKSADVINAKGSKDELYIKANQWMVRNFKDARSIIQFQDKQEGKIMGKYLLSSTTLRGMYGSVQTIDVYSLITISIKDNATKIDIEPVGTWKYDKSGLTVFNYSPEKAEADINNLIADYRKYMTSNIDSW